ncbi:MAG: GntR family transcriptional regulator [Actinobacteria bacterium]|nr:GntR family transcriptional regulator [Actinomycetota bacterium]
MMDSTDLSVIKLDARMRGRKITADYVADALREAIQSGSLPDGAVLKQAAIAERLGVSRVPVREAMRHLMAEGLIQSRAHHVAIVRSLSLSRIAEVYDYRALVEGHMTERAVAKLTEADVNRLGAKNEEMKSAASHSTWLRLNNEFHAIILEAAGDETGLELVEQLRLRSERYVRMWSGGKGVQNREDVNAEHAEVISLIAAGKAKKARQAIEKHIRHTGERVVASGTDFGRANGAPAAETT